MKANQMTELKQQIQTNNFFGCDADVTDDLQLFFRDDTAAIERVAYEFCEDQSLCGVLYFEVRYSPHVLCTTDLEQPEEKLVTPRDIVEAVNRGLKRGEHDFGVIARSILCCMRHMPGKID